MGIRENIRNMPDFKLTEFRETLGEMMQLNDERGYAHFAGLHGLPLPAYCQHGDGRSPDLLFLPWHRAYLYFMELALQDINPNVSLPWWDWTSDTSHSEGLPEAYSFKEVDGVPNPLNEAAIPNWDDQIIRIVRMQLPGVISARGNPPRTLRDPDLPDELPRKATIDDIMLAPSYDDFSLRLENVHGAVHVWVGGSMSSVPVAAYDPIFWAHHCMIDRLWYLWQISAVGVPPPLSIINTVLEPFNVTAGEMLNISSLGYDYASQVIS